MAKTLKLTPIQKNLLKELRIYISDHIDRYKDQIDEDAQELISEGFFKDEADFLAWEYFISHDCMKESVAKKELEKLEHHLSEETY